MADNYSHDAENGPSRTYNIAESRDSRRKSQRQSCKLIVCSQMFSVLCFAIGIAAGILIGIYAYNGGPSDKDDSETATQTPLLNYQSGKPQPSTGPVTSNIHPNTGQSLPDKAPKYCQHRNPVQDSRYEDSLYAPLTTEEMDRVAKFLKETQIITTTDQPTSLTETFILYQSVLPPVKSDALKYLDQDGEKPARHAKVTVQRGGISSPDIMEYKVGPLGANGPLTCSEITKPGDINFNTRPYEFLELQAMEKIVHKDLQILEPLIRESFDGASYPGDLYVNFLNGPPNPNGNERETRFNIGYIGFQTTEVPDLIHLLPLSGSVHNPGANVSTWYSYDFHYLNQGPFATAQELLNAYQNNEVRKVVLPKGYKDTTYNRIYPRRDSSKPMRKYADVPGPRTYLPNGPRFTVSGTHVEYMGWSFDISGGQIRGPALFDIRYKNERIIYEHAVNDIALNYAMDSHAQHNIVYMDATYGIFGGDTPSFVIKGVDCPEHGTVLNTSYWWSVTQKSYDMAGICIFEADAQEALWRHSSPPFDAGLRNRYLVVRAPVVVGNYDYTFEFHFYLDGKIFTRIMATGYIQASFWDEHNPRARESSRDAFGYRVSDHQTGPIHDHMFGFKVDMDIIDKNNTFEIVKWKAGPVLEALKTQTEISEAPGYFLYNETRYIEWERMETEIGIQDTPEQQFWLIVNERHKNKWGVERGYQIAPLETGSQSLTSNHAAMRPLSFTKYHCAVTKRKEEEPALSNIYDINRMNNPKDYLDSHINDESIVDDDIVSWVAVGFLHLPTSEDFPMTVRVEAGFLIRPFNFFDRTDSFDMPQHTDTRDHSVVETEPEFEPCYEPQVKTCRLC